ncbi:O-antigen/teichoic acid export membrane protein [Pseudonocardia hierapolitana]|uniref:O-antigen/teichoic acid export membrane protein n=2 Tax=Pseudonocardia hierapolitana TaxID=1128676 RepID=A0A561SKF6_9PSEU|nr:O-antigen/teichoic acid export membrane protein [Pseudonocardia hierapolitana]
MTGEHENTDGWRAPQHRDGMALVLSSGVSSAIGMLFWVLAARLFEQDTVGVNSAALSAVTLLASASHLNLGNAILRFVPVSDGRRALVAGCFAVGIGWGAVVGLGFGIGANLWAPDLVAAFGHPALIAFYLLSVPIWTVFVLQDSALTAIKRAPLVLVENIVFALLKIALLVVAAWLGLVFGIAVGTLAATFVLVLAVTTYLARALRRQPVPAPQAVQEVTARDLAGFVGVDYAGNVAWQAAVFGLPLIVIALTDAGGAAVYGVAWQVTYALYLVASGMGKSMVAHSAGGDSAAIVHARRGMDRKAITLVLPGALVVAGGSYLILSVFGSRYAETGALLLALLALSAIPNVVTNSALWEARVRRNRAVQFGLPAATSAAVITCTLVLIPAIGVTGAGWAWLGAQGVAAAVILLHRRRAQRLDEERKAAPIPPS